MGCSPFRVSRSSYDIPVGSGAAIPANNPNPLNFMIEDHRQIRGFLLLLVHYPDCTNYEGRKILMYEGVTLADIKNQGTIDPHFSDNKQYHSPIARFEPTLKGMRMAMQLATFFKG